MIVPAHNKHHINVIQRKKTDRGEISGLMYMGVPPRKMHCVFWIEDSISLEQGRGEREAKRKIPLMLLPELVHQIAECPQVPLEPQDPEKGRPRALFDALQHLADKDTMVLSSHVAKQCNVYTRSVQVALLNAPHGGRVRLPMSEPEEQTEGSMSVKDQAAAAGTHPLQTQGSNSGSTAFSVH